MVRDARDAISRGRLQVSDLAVSADFSAFNQPLLLVVVICLSAGSLLAVMDDLLDNHQCYIKSMSLWNDFWQDVDLLKLDLRGREIARQLTRSTGSVSANIEEGYGRGFGREYIQFLRYSRGSARETKGWYQRGRLLLPKITVESRIVQLDEIISMQNGLIKSLERRISSK